jgi:hypothetical protein
MSDDVIALIVTILVIALLFAWAPFLNFICPPCSRFLAQRRMERQTVEDQRIKKRSSVAAVRH